MSWAYPSFLPSSQDVRLAHRHGAPNEWEESSDPGGQNLGYLWHGGGEQTLVVPRRHVLAGDDCRWHQCALTNKAATHGDGSCALSMPSGGPNLINSDQVGSHQVTRRRAAPSPR